MKTVKIGVTDDDVRQRGAECRTFSEEHWLSMTEAQQTTLVDARKGVLVRAAQLVRNNETDAAIGDKMERLRRSKNEDDELVRDIYFSIADESVRIKAINDLFDFESARKNHDSATVLEAYYRFSGVQKKLLRGCFAWPDFRRFLFHSIVMCAVILGAFVLLEGKSFLSSDPAGFLVIIYIVGIWATGFAHWVGYKVLEAQWWLRWEDEKLRRGIREEPHLELLVRRCALFSDTERQTGIRSVRREFN